MSNTLNKILKGKQFFHHYQFIYEVNNCHPIGLEVLFRSHLISNPHQIFLDAKKHGKLFDLETTSIAQAIKELNHKIYDTEFPIQIFVNLFPSTIVNPNFLPFMNKLISQTSISKSNIVFEINEEELIKDHDKLLHNIKEMKNEGYQFAVDDFGKGYGSIQTVIELEPSYIKLDKFFARNLATSQQKQEMIRSMVTYSDRIGVRLILEGIELPEELYEARNIGITFGQGFLLSKPAPLHKIPMDAFL